MSILNKVTHYQKKIERNKENTETLIHCINKLHKLPITGQHLEKTGVGKTVNALRKFGGDVENAAKALVWKWKRVVFAETIAEEEAKKERDLMNPFLCNSEADVLNAAKAEEERKETTSALITTAGNEDAKMLLGIGEENNSSTANLNHNISEYDSQCCDTLRQSTERDDKGYSSSSVWHVFSRNQSTSTEVQEQKSSRYHSHNSKHSHTRRDKRQHKKKSREHGIKIILEKVHTEDENNTQEENKSFSFDSFSTLTHYSKRAEKETKSSESEHYRKKQGQKRKTGRSEKCTENISKQSKYSEKVKNKFANYGSNDCFSEEIRMGDAKGEKRSGDTSTGSMRNSDSGTNTTNCSPNSIREFVPAKPDLCFVDTKLDVKIDVASMLPETYFNKNSFSHLPATEEDSAFKHATKQIVLPKQHRQRMKIYSGMKTGKPFPTLYELCIHVLKEHIDALEYTGGVPYDILKPILQQATPEQLFQVECYNSYLLEDTNELWEFHCRKEFPSSQLKPKETAREMYLRCLEDREAKFKALTSSIRQSLTKTSPVHQIKLAYEDSDPKPPRNVARKQAKYGTGNSQKSDGGKPQTHAPTSAARPSFFKNSTNSTTLTKPRMAPLMKKTMKLAKSFKR